MLRKVSQKYIRDGIRKGVYKDLTAIYNGANGDPEILPEQLDRYAYSSGQDGLNGSIFQHRETGEFYAIACRGSALIYYC